MNIAGLDIGTTGCKCSVYNENGEYLNEEYMEYSIVTNEKEHSIDPEMIWNCVLKVMNKISKKVDSISGICVTSFGEASVLLDENDNVLMNSLLFTDPNGDEEYKGFIERFGQEYIYYTTGLMPGKMYSAIKWKWISNNRPEIFKKCKYIFLIEDYIVYKLTGKRQIDYSLASRTMACDVNELKWDNEILEWANVHINQLPKLVPIGSKAGKLKEKLKEQLGLSQCPIIISGCHDQIAAAIGTGVIYNKMAVDGTGTVECITSVFNKESKIDKSSLSKKGYAVVPYIDDTFVTYAFSYTGGALLKWYRNELSPIEAEKSIDLGKNPYEEYNKLINLEKPSKLLVFPHFAGAGTPLMNNNAKGMIIGLSLDTTKGHIYQGLMEGTAYEMKINLDILEAGGINIDKIYATGGGASSKEWLQIKADIYNKEVVSLGSAQSGTLGCIMLAAVACDLYPNLKEASKVFIEYKERFLPRKQEAEQYAALFKQYKNIHDKLSKGEN